ncbi:DUF7660 family protein [Mucilaginibacter pedocola]|uniref:DUF7660 domain-containing protein n=1 Tax=Mucilaginibacter pedocola TaxID=1792845 RepID=A0A1S9PE96_9SPHI|nr:hypothetical protein [Mucilaginibacter pedocola]OOQ59275.1 hypothetical protein BC343_28555 [Mucilaginibacter pedocola]
MDEAADKLETIKTREDFVEFTQLLLKNLGEHPEDWENVTLKDYLGAIAAWTEDMDGYYRNMQLPMPANVDWKVFANILMAASIYE